MKKSGGGNGSGTEVCPTPSKDSQRFGRVKIFVIVSSTSSEGGRTLQPLQRTPVTKFSFTKETKVSKIVSINVVVVILQYEKMELRNKGSKCTETWSARH